MKKYILTLLVLFLPFALFAQGTGNNLANRIGVSMYAGANLPVIGNISSDIKTNDFVYAGPVWGYSLSYYFTKSIGVEVNNMFQLNFAKNKYRTNGKDPAISTYSFSVNGIYKFNELFKNTAISPFLKGGIGVYGWEHLDDAPWYGGEVVEMDRIKHKGLDFGFNVGLGADYLIANHFSIGLVLDYNMYFPKNEEKFGKDFAEQGNFTPQLKFTYYLPAF